jgi:hypothetical protein
MSYKSFTIKTPYTFGIVNGKIFKIRKSKPQEYWEDNPDLLEAEHEKQLPLFTRAISRLVSTPGRSLYDRIGMVDLRLRHVDLIAQDLAGGIASNVGILPTCNRAFYAAEGFDLGTGQEVQDWEHGLSISSSDSGYQSGIWQESFDLSVIDLDPIWAVFGSHVRIEAILLISDMESEGTIHAVLGGPVAYGLVSLGNYITFDFAGPTGYDYAKKVVLVRISFLTDATSQLKPLQNGAYDRLLLMNYGNYD